MLLGTAGTIAGTAARPRTSGGAGRLRGSLIHSALRRTTLLTPPPLRSHVGSHCTGGQKIEVVVTADGTAADEASSGRAVVAATAGLVVLVAMLF